MTLVLVFEEEVVRIICAYGSKMRRADCKKDQFYNKMACGWDLLNPGEKIGRCTDGLEDVHGGYGTDKKNVEEETMLKFCNEKK